MDIERDGNLIEAAVWGVLGLVLIIYAFNRPRYIRKTLHFLAVVMIIFGGSDIVESQTGAWWQPWWLFVWKALCVLGLLAGFVRYYRVTKDARPGK
jgi:predicted ferric reductase